MIFCRLYKSSVDESEVAWSSWMVTYGCGGDVGEISGNAGGVHDIVQSELVDKGAQLHKQGERLAEVSEVS